MSIIGFVRTIKAESSKWVKHLGTFYDRFAWQEGYGAFSVSESMVDRTYHYIRNQAEHHRKRTFKEEYRKLLEAYHIEFDEKYL